MNDSSSLSQMVLSTLRQITREVGLHSKILEKRLGLTVPQLLVLKVVVDAREVTMGHLAERVSLSQATVTTIVDRLESRGQITRHRGTTDRRQVLIVATDSGREIVARNPPLLQEEFVDAFSKLESWEQTQILSSLQRVAAMMDAHHRPASPILHADEVPDLLGSGPTGVAQSPNEGT